MLTAGPASRGRPTKVFCFGGPNRCIVGQRSGARQTASASGLTTGYRAKTKGPGHPPVPPRLRYHVSDRNGAAGNPAPLNNRASGAFDHA